MNESVALYFKRADVARSIRGHLHNRPRHSALVGGERATDHGNCVNRRAAGEQSVGPSVAAVVRQGAKQEIVGVGRFTIAAPNQIVAVRADGAHSSIAAWATDDAVSAFTGVAGDDRVHVIQMAPNVDASALAKGAVITDGAVDEAQDTMVIDPASGSDGSVAADGAIGEHCCATAGDVDTTTTAHISERVSVLGSIVANGAVDERQSASLTLDATAGATGVTHGTDSIGGIVADGAVDERQRTTVADAGPSIRSIVTDDTVIECQRAIVSDAAATLFLSAWPAMTNRHFLKD